MFCRVTHITVKFMKIKIKTWLQKVEKKIKGTKHVQGGKVKSDMGRGRAEDGMDGECTILAYILTNRLIERCSYEGARTKVKDF